MTKSRLGSIGVVHTCTVWAFYSASTIFTARILITFLFPPLFIIVKHNFWSTESTFDAGISEIHHFTSVTTNSRSVVSCSGGIGWMCHYVCGRHLFSLRKAFSTILLFAASSLASARFSSACRNHFLAFAKTSPPASFLSKDTCWILNSKIGWNALNGIP